MFTHKLFIRYIYTYIYMYIYIKKLYIIYTHKYVYIYIYIYIYVYIYIYIHTHISYFCIYNSSINVEICPGMATKAKSMAINAVLLLLVNYVS